MKPLFSIGLAAISLLVVGAGSAGGSQDCPQMIRPNTVRIEVLSQGGHALNKIEYVIDLPERRMILRRYSPKEETKETVMSDRDRIGGIQSFFASGCFAKKKSVGQPPGGYEQVKIVDGDGTVRYLAPSGGVHSSAEYYEMTNDQRKEMYRILPAP